MQNANGQRGFSLIELIIACAVLVILAAIAIPNYIASRRATRENLNITKLANIGAAANTFQKQTTLRRYPYLGELNDKLPGQTAPFCVIKDDASAVGLTTTTITNSDARFVQSQTLGPGGIPNALNVLLIPLRNGAPDTTRPTYAVYEDGVVRTNNRPYPDHPSRTAPAAKR